MSIFETKKHIQNGIALSDKSFKTKLTPNFRLSIYLNGDQFAFCVTDILSRKLLYLKSYNFFNILNKEEYSSAIKQLIAGDEYLKLTYGKTNIHFLSDCFTLVPTGLFDDLNKAALLEFNQHHISSMYVKSDSVLNSEAHIIYGMDMEIEKIVTYYFANAEVKHSAGALLESLITLNGNHEFLFCYVQPSTIQIAFIQKSKLKFFNIYQYKTPEDFIYFLMNVVNHLSLDQDQLKLIFGGEVVADSLIYKLAYKYIRNIEFAMRPEWIQCSNEMQFPPHFYFNLFCIES